MVLSQDEAITTLSQDEIIDVIIHNPSAKTGPALPLEVEVIKADHLVGLHSENPHYDDSLANLSNATGQNDKVASKTRSRLEKKHRARKSSELNTHFVHL